MKKVTTSTLLKMKQDGQKITVLTAYDASFAKLFDEAGIDAMLIGDSLGMVLRGEDSTLAVTVDNIAYHTQSVSNGTERALVIADMPFMSYATPEQTYNNAARLMAAGANMVKLEGGEWLVERGIPVCGHLGLTPQSVNVFGGFKVQGREENKGLKILEDAKRLEQAGIQMLVLECVPTDLAKRVTEEVSIPVIGIGAGNKTDGQVLVMHDMFGISANYMPKFSKNYLQETGDIRKAVALFIEEVQSGVFPSEAHSFN
jgi:3-methyl-2-oxobutanoate hydroxymethyltransferase